MRRSAMNLVEWIRTKREKYFGDIVRASRRDQINQVANDHPEDNYINMYIEHAKPREKDPVDIEGKLLTAKELSSVCDEIYGEGRGCL